MCPLRGAPVKLSVGKIKSGRRQGGLAAAESNEIQHIGKHLRRAVKPSRGGIATLAVVPVDDPRVGALSLVSLALSCAQEGLKVIVATCALIARRRACLGQTDRVFIR